MGSKKKEIPAYLYHDDCFGNFAMVTADLFASPQFQSLSYAAQTFYLLCAAHKQTPEQKQCLYQSLKEYYALLGEEIPDIDLQMMAGTAPRAKVRSTYFVIPQSQMEQYGYKPAYASKLKRELIDKHFIKVFANEKKHSASDSRVQGGNRDFSKRVTIYQFISDWKKD